MGKVAGSARKQTAKPNHGHELDALLKHPQLWRADQLEVARDGLKTGFTNLDTALHGTGWPKAGLMELLGDQPGIGELRLLAPALSALSAEQRWISWVNPPHIPYAPALEALGIEVAKVLLVHPRNHRDALWALEQALKSGTCSSVLAWLDEGQLKQTDLRRLQLAAKMGNCLAVLFRPAHAARQQSPAELRIRLHAQTPPQRDVLEIEILKRRGGWPPEPFAVQLEHLSITLPELTQRLALWRRHRQRASPQTHRRPDPQRTDQQSDQHSDQQRLH
jgi:hypothetical protein